MYSIIKLRKDFVQEKVHILLLKTGPITHQHIHFDENLLQFVVDPP